MTMTVKERGNANFGTDEALLSPDAFVKEATTKLDNDTLTMENLQMALANANLLNMVVVSSVVTPTNNPGGSQEQKLTEDKLSNGEIVAGFTLLFATVICLVLWVHVCWNK